MEFSIEQIKMVFFIILAVMAFIVLWLTIERLFFYAKVDISSYKHIESLQVDLTKNLTTISIVGANAPYVGLVGTVIGILIVFYKMGLEASIDTGTIMTGLALALEVTAAGIGVAIPSIMSYNGLMRKVDVFSAQFVTTQVVSPSQSNDVIKG